MRTFVAATLAAAVTASDHWAVLIAGSKGYDNYRHQADVAHAYTIFKKNGIPAENIIYMAYDDVAQSPENPYRGKLFNKTDGPNVYDASVVDYKGEQVSIKNFLAVLTGDEKTTGGKVLKSTEESNVFVYYADHGAPGIICLPADSRCDKLYADQLNDAFETMKSKKMFKQMTFYMEACESGSMFPHLTSDGGIYGVTASNATQPSSGTYCGSEATVNGKVIANCLGDLFSTSWMEDTDAAIAAGHMGTETLQQQFDTVKQETTASPVNKFGDFSFMSEAIGAFEGTNSAISMFDSLLSRTTDLFTDKRSTNQHVDQRDAKLYYLTQRVMQEGGDENHAALMEEITQRSFFDKTFKTAYPGLLMSDLKTELEDYDCYRFLIDSFETSCGTFSDYGFKYAKYLRHTCIVDDQDQITETAKKFTAICQ